MDKVWEYLIDIFIAIIIMFVAVTIYFGLRTETVMKSVYENATDEFISNTKRNGFIAVRDYEDYMVRMGVGRSLFDITLEHEYKLYEPEYRLKTIEEIEEEQRRAYDGLNNYHYREVKTEKPHVDDPINDGNLNTETNESILVNANNNPSNPGHVHGEGCYNGHRHIGKPVFIHEHAHTSSCIEFISYIKIPSVCNTCHKSYTGGSVDYYWDQQSRSAVHNFTMLDGTRECPYCGSHSISSGEQIKYYQYSCFYNTVQGIIGSTERTPYGVIYEYEESNPQDDTMMSTHTSGCYAYHLTKELSDAYEYEFGSLNEPLNESRMNYVFNNMMYTDLFEGYCYIPKYIRIGISTNYYYDNRDLSDLPELCYITYTPYLNENGKIRFKFVNYMRTDYEQKSFYGSDNPGFPTNISAQELINLSRSWVLKDLFYDFFGTSYIDRITSYDKHIQWFSGGYRSFPGSPSRLIDETQYVNVCGFDHSVGIDRWIHTCGYDEDSTVDCDKIIESLEPTNSIQTVYTNDPLITTAKATYKDGSTKIVVCTTSFDTSRIVRDKDTTITYINVIDGVSHTHNATITVTVIPRNKTCPKGHIYNMNLDGTDPGCPYCKEWIESLRIIYPTTSPIVITIGTSLKDNNLTLLATYMDGHTEEVTSGYIDNLDIHYLGTKPVTIGYKGASVTVIVTTKCATMICDICGYEYNLYPDGTNPGCPRCISRIPVFTGNVMEYEHVNNTVEILDMLYEDGQYNFNVNDTFKINVSNKSSSLARMLLKKVYPSLSNRWLMIERKEHIMTK